MMKNFAIIRSTLTQKMRGNSALVALSIVSLATFGARKSHAAAAFAEATSFVGFDGKDAGTYLYNNLSFKLRDRLTFAPEMLNLLQYKAAGVQKSDFSHLYLRFTLAEKEVAQIGNWKMGMTYRYAPPTTQSAQRQGSLGTVLIRPDISRTMGKFSLTVREGFSFYLQRNGYQINVPRDKAVGNPLFSAVFNPTLEYTLATDFTAMADVLVINQFNGPGPGGVGTDWNHELWQEYGFNYGGKSLAGWGLGLTLLHISEFGPDKDFKLFSKIASMNFKVNKEF